MEAHDNFVGYLVGGQVQTWPGGLLATVIRRWAIPHNWAGQLVCVRAQDRTGAEWYGRGLGDGVYIRMHRAKVVTA
jgi:hypothetical protein